MKKITVVLDDLTVPEMIQYLSVGDIWITASDQNSSHLRSLVSQGTLVDLPGEVTKLASEKPLSRVLEEIFDHYHENSFDGPFSGSWSSITVRGATIAEVKNAANIFGNLSVAQEKSGIRIARSSR